MLCQKEKARIRFFSWLVANPMGIQPPLQYLFIVEICETSQFDRVTYMCPNCSTGGCISNVWVNLTAVRLEGYCPRCGTRSVRSYSLLHIDRWLTGECERPCPSVCVRPESLSPVCVDAHHKRHVGNEVGGALLVEFADRASSG